MSYCALESSKDEQIKHDEHRQNIRNSYTKVAQAEEVYKCCGVENSCCDISDDMVINTLTSSRLGYSNEDIKKVPKGSDMGIGCGNQKSIAELRTGETVVDLGYGGGFDCFLSADDVGKTGYVIGVDMTPDM